MKNVFTSEALELITPVCNILNVIPVYNLYLDILLQV